MKVGRRRPGAYALAVVLALLGYAVTAPGTAAADTRGPAVTLSRAQAGTGGSVTVTGAGWRPRALLMLLVCGQAGPAGGVPGGTGSCAHSRGRAVTTDGDGAFRRHLPVTEPPRPCPCVVRVATVTGAKASATAPLTIAGHPVRALPKPRGGRLAVLGEPRLDGADGVLTWFGAAPSRRLVLTVGNRGSTPVVDPVFRIGAARGVRAPRWEEQQWRGTVAPGGKARISLPVELPAGAHGDHLVALRHGTDLLAEHPWKVGRPWGVPLFWTLLCLVGAAATVRTTTVLARWGAVKGTRDPEGKRNAPDESLRSG
ncbi:hypothetical protein [Streptomyces longispororuber]|uniref:hypothetical protein n=1 Tax=Streptomyces longispororuber TaxID=68230 RepID=UPI003F566F65